MTRLGRPAASITRRLGIAVGVVLCVLVIDLVSTVWGVVQLGTLDQQVQRVDLPLRNDDGALLNALVMQQGGARGYLLTHDTAFATAARQGQSAEAQLVPALRSLAARRPGLGPVVDGLAARVAAYETQYVVPVLAAPATPAPQDTAATLARGAALFAAIQRPQATVVASVDAATTADFAQASSARFRILSGVLVRAALGIGLGVLLLVVALRAILRPVAGLRGVARALRDGEPVVPRSAASPAELAEVHDIMVAAASTLQARETALARANQELEEANRLKSEFLATMSHELRTPLNSILGFTDLVRSGATGQLTTETDECLERVRRNGSLLLDLINDILDLSKIESGRLVVGHEVVEVEPIVREVMADVQGTADAKGLDLYFTAAGEETLVIADRRAVKQVITNLLSNAVKFTSAGSITVALRTGAGALFVDVVDTGQGIASDDQAIVFEPFRQVGAHARTGTGGTGLGLPISVRLARLMGGDLRLHSESQKGSRFTLRLPAVHGYAGAARNHRGPVILGVDDDLDALSLWQAQCERMGFDFVGVQQSSSAIAAAATLKPVAILLDIVFPEASGWDVLNALRADPRTAGIPVHVISITDGMDRAGDAAVSFLQKPVSEDELRAELAMYLHAPAGAVA